MKTVKTVEKKNYYWVTIKKKKLACRNTISVAANFWTVQIHSKGLQLNVSNDILKTVSDTYTAIKTNSTKKISKKEKANEPKQ